MLTWQIIILLQIIVSSLNTLWYRKISLKFSKNTFGVLLLHYFVIFLAGSLLAIVNYQGLPPLDNKDVYKYLLGEGIFIPLAWLLSYKLLSIIGASALVIAQSFTFIITALFGVMFLGDPLTSGLIIGSVFLITAVYLALSINGDKKSKHKVGVLYKLLLLVSATISFALGIMFEKIALDMIGIYSYAMYGWFTQFLGAAVIVILFGRKVIIQQFKSPLFVKYGVITGLLTALSGILFITALSKELLSSVVLASTAKIALTSFLAIWLLRERTYIIKRVVAVLLAIMGLFIIFSI